MTSALLITLIGMGLVFAALALFWGLMEVLVRLTAPRPEVISSEVSGDVPLAKDFKAQAVAIAVSIALAEAEQTQVNVFPPPPTAFVSAWQAIQRARRLNQRGPVR